MSKKKEDALTITTKGQVLDKFDPSTALELQGKQIIATAIEKIQGEYRDRVVGYVTASMEQINVLLHNIEEAQEGVDFYRRRLKAIQDNEFTINRIGQIQFNEWELNG